MDATRSSQSTDDDDQSPIGDFVDAVLFGSRASVPPEVHQLSFFNGRDLPTHSDPEPPLPGCSPNAASRPDPLLAAKPRHLDDRGSTE